MARDPRSVAAPEGLPHAIQHPSIRCHLVAMVLLVALVGGCAGQGDESTAVGQSTTSTTVAPTTTVAPMTAEELAWLKAIPKVRKKIDKSIQTIRKSHDVGDADARELVS